jgi:hypothetical protein
MKKTILSIAVAAFFAACSPQSSEVKTVAKAETEDTTGLSQFKEWKQEQQALIDAPQMTEESFNTSAVQEQQVARQNVQPRVIYKTIQAKQPIARVSKPAPARRDASVSPRIPSPTKSSEGTESSSDGTGVSNDAGTGVSDAPVASTETPKEEKKGWSKAAQGTVIGAGSGAVLGAILTKDKAKGAVIGGIIGAGAGYALGRAKDKKDGRY